MTGGEILGDFAAPGNDLYSAPTRNHSRSAPYGFSPRAMLARIAINSAT
jgi:hypothetical protein